jgi:hypothetical protein
MKLDFVFACALFKIKKNKNKITIKLKKIHTQKTLGIWFLCFLFQNQTTTEH